MGMNEFAEAKFWEKIQVFEWWGTWGIGFRCRAYRVECEAFAEIKLRRGFTWALDRVDFSQGWLVIGVVILQLSIDYCVLRFWKHTLAEFCRVAFGLVWPFVRSYQFYHHNLPSFQYNQLWVTWYLFGDFSLTLLVFRSFSQCHRWAWLRWVGFMLWWFVVRDWWVSCCFMILFVIVWSVIGFLWWLWYLLRWILFLGVRFEIWYWLNLR